MPRPLKRTLRIMALLLGLQQFKIIDYEINKLFKTRELLQVRNLHNNLALNTWPYINTELYRQFKQTPAARSTMCFIMTGYLPI
jgi:hypothetical protein